LSSPRVLIVDDHRLFRSGVRAELEPLLEEVFAGRDASEWLLRLEHAEIPSGRVNTLREVMAHPELSDGGLVTEIGSPVGSIPTIASAILLGAARPPVGDVPALGEHTHEVLAELGLGEREIEALTANG
jgi:crotonobetainyl-CoA:carnitine CoA-transferase CaiB-like acyl-CoA transferase